MKIIGGKYKGRNIYMPADIRPTQNVVRKAIIDMLGQDLDGLEFLELFAGSAAVGLEALSHGAKKVVFVEKDPKCIKVIEKNLAVLPIKPGPDYRLPYELIQQDSFAMIKRLAERNIKFDIVFLDPPYGADLAKKALKTLGGHDILQPNCFLIVQHSKYEILPQSEGRFNIIKQKKYGSTRITVYQGTAESA